VQDLLEQGEDVQDTLEAIEMAFEEKIEGDREGYPQL